MAIGPGQFGVLLDADTRSESGQSAPIAWDRAARGMLIRCAPNPDFTAGASLVVRVVDQAEQAAGPSFGVLATFGTFFPGYLVPQDNTVERFVQRYGPLPNHDQLLVVTWVITGTSPSISFGVSATGYQD